MVVRDAILRVLNQLVSMRRTLLRRAEAEAETVMPGYTHLLHAQPTTIDSVSASDHVTETAAALAGLMTIVDRLSQDLYVWSSQEFGLIDVTDAFASPSSLMPQKKNALVLEYVRSRTARTIGALAGCF